jgi:acetyl esterase/lipase
MPSLFVYPAPQPTGAAALMFPGGGFAHVAIGAGSGDIARQFNARGVSVFMLKYRLPSGHWAAGPDAVLQDAQRAVRLIRADAERYAINPEQIAALGFSAGGYGAAALVARSGAETYHPIDHADRLSARPDLAGLFYPVIVLDGPAAHQGSRTALLGAAPNAEDAARYSPYRHVTAGAPPTFLAHACDDTTVPVDNSILMFEALHSARVAAQLHAFERGGHGLNLEGPAGEAARGWMGLFLDWAARHGFPLNA